MTHASVAGKLSKQLNYWDEPMRLVREKLKLNNLIVNHAQYDGV